MSCRTSAARVLWLVLTLSCVAAPLRAQNAVERRGFWIGFGFGPGFAEIDCDECGPREQDGPWDGGAGPSLYLRPALGVGGAALESGTLELETTGMTGSFGLGYDVRVGRRFALSPHVKVVQSFSEGTTSATLTGSRTGPDFPRYLAVNLGFHWY